MADPRIIPDPPFAWAEGAPYSQAVRVGDLVFTSGQGGLADPAHLDVWRAVRADVLRPPFPATTAVSTALLFDGMLCEIDAVAVVG